jgi:hypothetical protein
MDDDEWWKKFRSFEDYKYSESTKLIQRLRHALKNGWLRDSEERDFVTTILKICFLDYELSKLSPKRQLWIIDILHRVP